MEYFLNTVVKLFPFLKTTLFIAVTAMVLGLFFGSMLAAMKLSDIKPLMAIANIFTMIIRCTPVVVLLFLCYYGLPLVLSLIGIDISGFSKEVFSISALTMFASAILSEILRPAYLSVNKGQMEAAVMTGLSEFTALRLIIIPQVLFVALPNCGNMMITLFQESALAYLIGVIDVMGQARVIISLDHGVHIIEIYLAASVIYWILSVVTGKAVDLVNARMSRILR